MSSVEFKKYEQAIKALALYSTTYGFEDEEAEIFRGYLEACKESSFQPCEEVIALNLCEDAPEIEIEKFEYEIIRELVLSYDAIQGYKTDFEGFKSIVISDLSDRGVFLFDGCLDWDVIDITVNQLSIEKTKPSMLERVSRKEKFNIQSEVKITLSFLGNVLTDDSDEAKESISCGVADAIALGNWKLVSEDHSVKEV